VLFSLSTFIEIAKIDLVLEFVDGGDLLEYILCHNGVRKLMALLWSNVDKFET